LLFYTHTVLYLGYWYTQPRYVVQLKIFQIPFGRRSSRKDRFIASTTQETTTQLFYSTTQNKHTLDLTSSLPSLLSLHCVQYSFPPSCLYQVQKAKLETTNQNFK
jgi:hypothetical protein